MLALYLTTFLAYSKIVIRIKMADQIQVQHATDSREEAMSCICANQFSLVVISAAVAVC